MAPIVRPFRGNISVGTKPKRSRSAVSSKGNVADFFCSGDSVARYLLAASAMVAGDRSAAYVAASATTQADQTRKRGERRVCIRKVLSKLQVPKLYVPRDKCSRAGLPRKSAGRARIPHS